jgi:hypothetical protein
VLQIMPQDGTQTVDQCGSITTRSFTDPETQAYQVGTDQRGRSSPHRSEHRQHAHAAPRLISGARRAMPRHERAPRCETRRACRRAGLPSVVERPPGWSQPAWRRRSRRRDRRSPSVRARARARGRRRRVAPRVTQARREHVRSAPGAAPTAGRPPLARHRPRRRDRALRRSVLVRRGGCRGRRMVSIVPR